jgi:hypothetical protein
MEIPNPNSLIPVEAYTGFDLQLRESIISKPGLLVFC